ncbi:PadR family transcriptional regulator [Kibdelosporangium aridum]|uniref:PadR family transcriptional regulator n=1 Tax=Kibdelosporangium aridum TaxID=2030 RepID=UPI000A035288
MYNQAMPSSPKVTRSMEDVLYVFMDDPARSYYGYKLCESAGVSPGRLYPLLARLEATGWLTSGWESNEADQGIEPRRRYYRITSSGMEGAAKALQQRTPRRLLTRFRLPTWGWTQ